MSVRVFAPAKINLTLQVGRLRDDGLHPLRSVVAFADIGDWIEAASAEQFSLHVTGPFAPGLAGDEHNLVMRAAHALQHAIGATGGARMVLEKNLPLASGIGGGSSDAAATLKALNTLWGLGLSAMRLAELGAKLGADVPVCVAAKSAHLTGAGEQVTPLTLPALPAVLVNPLRCLSTADVYRRFDAMGLGGEFSVGDAPDWRDRGAVVSGVTALGNDLERPALALAPELADVRARLAPGARCVGLSGSGATMFALFEDAERAQAEARRIRAERPSWWVHACGLAAP